MARYKRILLALIVAALACQAPGSRAQSPSQEEGQKEITTLEVFLPIMVFNKKGEFVPGLTRSNFRVFENGKEQRITSFDAPSQLPLDIAILIDTSNSVKRKLTFEKEAAAAFVLAILERKTDRALVASFASDVMLHVDFSRDSGELTRAIDGLKAGGNTRLYDCIFSVCEQKMGLLPPGSRPVMLIVTDGQDVGSDHTLEEAVQIAQRTNVTIFAISTRNYADVNAGTTKQSVDKELEQLCESTGGRTFLPYQRLELERAFAGVRTLLRNQYVIYYEPTDQNRDGKFRKVEVKLEGSEQKAEIRAKRGYYALPPSADSVPR